MKKLNEFKKTRVLSGLSQTEVAELLGFTQQNVSFSIATEQEMKILGKAWQIYSTRLVKTRERQDSWNFTFMPELRIKWEELE